MSRINAGDLDRVIDIMQPEGEDDGLSNVPGAPIFAGRRRAKKTDISDGERFRASQLGQEVTTRFLVRSDTLTRSITGRDSLIYNDGDREITYAVVGTKEWGDRRDGIEITAVARPDATP